MMFKESNLDEDSGGAGDCLGFPRRWASGEQISYRQGKGRVRSFNPNLTIIVGKFEEKGIEVLSKAEKMGGPGERPNL